MDPIKCKNCEVAKKLRENTGDLACCMWYMDHVVICDEPVENCPKLKRWGV